jgi:deoxyribodipyrimidine photolyase-related protein
MKAILIFPHHLFACELSEANAEYWLIEEKLFFSQFHFHPMKIAYHRATMKHYETELLHRSQRVHYIEADQVQSDVRQLMPLLRQSGVKEVHAFDVCDDWLKRRMNAACRLSDLNIVWHTSPMFLESNEDVVGYAASKKRLFHADFYKQQRIKHGILIDAAKQPLGGQWSFDEDNRKRYPKGRQVPAVKTFGTDEVWEEASAYALTRFDNPYDLKVGMRRYPITRKESHEWLQDFLLQRFANFGEYEDAIVRSEHFLHHSVLTPMLNVGLLTPREVIDAAIACADEQEIPLNSLEGFIRQVLGWREFIRMVYVAKGREERIRNYWGFKRKLPLSFWMGTTGILPLDETIRKVRETGYCHHIERLMVLGNAMLLNEFDPDDVYRWFMALFIDAYDWVMVPNVYGMSQFADGGMMATKPYISGSNYLIKMSDYPKGGWQFQWDAWFWRFMHIHRDFFLKNPRLSMLVRSFDKMTEEKRRAILDVKLLE